VIAAMPKSASSFLTLAIGSLPGMKIKSIAQGRGRNEQELDSTRLAYRALTPYVAQHHVRFGDTTAALIRKFGITPVILVRDLADALVSLRDHMRNEDYVGPMAWLTGEHVRLGDKRLEELLADLVMPWYVSFYVGWKACPAGIWVEYDEIRTRPEAVVERVVSAAAIPCGKEEIQRAIEAAMARKPRFNEGISGRGRHISDYAKQRIARLLSYYPEVDFSPIWRH
jgi:hypothetical protein